MSGCFCSVQSQNVRKLDPRALKCVFVVYSPTQKGYKFYHPPIRRYFVSTNVTFREDESNFSIKESPFRGEHATKEFTRMPSTIALGDFIQSEEPIQGEIMERLNKSNLKAYEEIR